MKKLILLASTLLISSVALVAQSTLLVTETAHGASISNGQTIYLTVGGSGSSQYDINIKNIGSTTKTYKMKMFYDVRNYVAVGDTANPFFCYGGTCEVPNTMTSKSETLTPNQDALSNSHPISVHYDEASIAGLSSIRYRIYDVNNPNVDFMEFTMKYNDPTASIKTNASLLSFVSDIFPNPSNIKASINITSLYDFNNVVVSITNALGSIVSSKHIELYSGKNNIDLDSQALSSGLYFATISVNNIKITKKFTISK